MKRLMWAFGLLVIASCSRSGASETKATYDPNTGKLTCLESDLNKNGKPDAWTYMDGGVPLRTEQDRNEDGKIDRWEYVTPDGTVTKVLISATGDANKVSRWESYDQGDLDTVEEDTNGDGRPDKWEKHRGVPIVHVEFDMNFDGLPDQRWNYGANATVESIETQPDGRGGYSKKVKPGS